MPITYKFDCIVERCNSGGFPFHSKKPIAKEDKGPDVISHYYKIQNRGAQAAGDVG